IVLNCKKPSAANALKKSLEEKYAAPVVAVNVETMGETELCEIMQKALFEFPLTCIEVQIPLWLQTYDEDNRVISGLMSALKTVTPNMTKMRDCLGLETLFDADADFYNPQEIKMDLGKGRVEISLAAKEDLFYRIVSEECGEEIVDELSVLRYIRALAGSKREYDKIKDAFAEAEQTGYGIVEPTDADYALEKPELNKKSAGYGVRFKANATSYHIIKVEVNGAVNPIIGTKQQGEDFLDETLRSYETDDNRVWETNIFGKSLRALVGDELSGKSCAMPPELRKKLRRITSRIVNEHKNNLISILF
ncbi:MAG: stage IV sporulation protein A, partial [Clostridia bacterium]|nr:stage IV sporulation protein A [Clostridia bacterium]